MKKPRNVSISLEERKKIEKLLKANYSYTVIGEKLGRARSCITAEVLRGGGRRGYKALVAHDVSLKIKEQRIKKLKRELTVEDEAMIQEMMKAKATKTAIQESLRCNHMLLTQWFIDNAPDYRGAQKYYITERVDALEKQIEILMDLVKGLLHEKDDK